MVTNYGKGAKANAVKLSRSLSGVEAILPASAPLSQRSSAQPMQLRSANATPLSRSECRKRLFSLTLEKPYSGLHLLVVMLLVIQEL